MNLAPALRLVDAAAAVLLLLPLMRLTQIVYDRTWFWSLSDIDLLPFPTRWSLRSPLWAWVLLFWAVALHAVISAVAHGNAGKLAMIGAGVEVFYGLLARRRRIAPLDPSFPGSVLAFALWHNAFLEELIFRGIPLLVGLGAGLSTKAFWPYVYIPVTAIAFGVYHYRMGRRARVFDTTLFGALLGFVALRYGFSAAILLHIMHNARSMPLGHSDPSLRLWRRNRHLHVAGLTIVGLLRVIS